MAMQRRGMDFPRCGERTEEQEECISWEENNKIKQKHRAGDAFGHLAGLVVLCRPPQEDKIKDSESREALMDLDV